MLHRNSGEIRFFIMLGMALGAVLYFCTVSRWVVAGLVTVIRFIQRVVISVIRIVTFPFRMLYALLSPPAKKAAKKIREPLRAVARYGRIKLEKSKRNRTIIRKKV
jgi:hypothetical protein